MSDLVTKLLAAIEDVERIAREATPGPWRVDNATYPEGIHNDYGDCPVAGGRWGDEASVFDQPSDAHHIALHDPASVLRMCSAHREIVEHAQSDLDLVDDDGQVITDGEVHIDRDNYETVEEAAAVWYLALTLLARAYGIEEGS